MGTIVLDGSLSLQPDPTEFASGLTGPFPLGTAPNPKTYVVRVSGVKNLASPSSFVALSGIGAGQDVTNGTFLYMRTNGRVSVRITLAGQSPYVTFLNGTLMQEFDGSALLTLVEVEGTAQIEYVAAGNT